jgi:uncharacterized OsmC-like protein
MKIILTGEESLRIEPTTGMLTIEAESQDESYSPFHMLGSALGMCTFSVLRSWGTNRNVSTDDLRIGVSWRFVEGQHRIEEMGLKLDWPSLSAELWPRALRAAHLCGIHQTLAKPPQITVDAAGTESPAIEAPTGMESRRPTGPSPAPIPQADGQPQPTTRP